jgi:phage shock protein PspC (stress-responsive transcriptional regulator)
MYLIIYMIVRWHDANRFVNDSKLWREKYNYKVKKIIRGITRMFDNNVKVMQQLFYFIFL